MIHVVLPAHLRTLARIQGEILLDLARPTQSSVIDALELCYPPLRGTIRDYTSGRRRPFLRFYACGEDLSNEDPQALLPEAVACGKEPYLVIGSVAGG